MQITWNDLGRPETPGEIMWRGAFVHIQARHIEEWRKDPDASYVLVPIQGNVGHLRYGLGQGPIPSRSGTR